MPKDGSRASVRNFGRPMSDTPEAVDCAQHGIGVVTQSLSQTFRESHQSAITRTCVESQSCTSLDLCQYFTTFIRFILRSSDQ
jgi:hypothetical protein